jgi:hypothetical protein
MSDKTAIQALDTRTSSREVTKHAQSGSMIKMEVTIYATIYPTKHICNTSVKD